MHKTYNSSKQLLIDYKNQLESIINSDQPVAVQRFLNYLIKHLFDESLTVTKAKKSCNITDKNFSSRFSLYTGATPKQFILEHRTHVARHLLLETTLTLSQISILTGFSTHSAFSKAFKNRQGGGKSIRVAGAKFRKKFTIKFKRKFKG